MNGAWYRWGEGGEFLFDSTSITVRDATAHLDVVARSGPHPAAQLGDDDVQYLALRGPGGQVHGCVATAERTDAGTNVALHFEDNFNHHLAAPADRAVIDALSPIEPPTPTDDGWRMREWRRACVSNLTHATTTAPDYETARDVAPKHYRQFSGRRPTDTLLLGIAGHDAMANASRGRRAELFHHQRALDPNPDTKPFGLDSLVAHHGDVRAAASDHDRIQQAVDEYLAELQGQAFPEQEIANVEQEIHDDLDQVLAQTPHDQSRPVDNNEVTLGQGPSQRQQADVREVVTDANAVQTDTGNVAGGDGDSRAARDASLRASTSLTQAHAAAPRTTGRASAAMSQQQRQQLAASATLAAREKVHTDHVREDAEDDLRARDDMRDYPSMDQRSAQRETGRSMGMGR